MRTETGQSANRKPQSTRLSSPQSAIEEIPTLGSPAQTCPACDGLLPADAIHYGNWRRIDCPSRPYYQREISMKCPHCGRGESRSQRLPVMIG